ncbi:UPF0262 family protein [Ensifer aridi]|uniref:UPF0262 family protein n=1 Tax=Ensifer aridi TaxID=1708715 RepID=UPI001FCE159B|nr:UPF0262 family protein [Ensifer aridi]
MTSIAVDGDYRLCDVVLDGSFRSRHAHVERERSIAIYDLLEKNTFMPVGHDGGPYCLSLASTHASLALHITTENGAHVLTHYLALAPFRRLLKDYIVMCDSFYDALHCATTAKFETIDMARSAIHNDAAELLRKQLASKVTVDRYTARRLFTLIYVLHVRRPSISLC